MDPNYVYEPPDVDPEEGHVWERLEMLEFTLFMQLIAAESMVTQLRTKYEDDYVGLFIHRHHDYDMTDEYWLWGIRPETAQDRLNEKKKLVVDEIEMAERKELRRLKDKYE